MLLLIDAIPAGTEVLWVLKLGLPGALWEPWEWSLGGSGSKKHFSVCADRQGLLVLGYPPRSVKWISGLFSLNSEFLPCIVRVRGVTYTAEISLRGRQGFDVWNLRSIHSLL